MFLLPNNQGSLNLGGLANNVIKKVNSQIKNPRYHFKPNNHNSISEKTSYPEQRLSATYYALTQAFIPAFGVETSKTIDKLEMKISLQKLVINTFMDLLGIELDTPGVDLKKPELAYILIKVNDGPSFAMPHGSTLKIKPGDEVIVTGIIANYKRGLIADLQGMGNRNDTNVPFRISNDAKITVRKDSEECGWVILDVDTPVSSGPETVAKIDAKMIKAEKLIINVNDTIESLPVGSTLQIKKDSRLILKGIRTNIPHLDSDVFINFKGFAPPKSSNNGNDLNYPIYINQDLWPRYSVNKKGKLYPVVATYNDAVIGEFWVEIAGN